MDNVNAKVFLLDEGHQWPQGSQPFRACLAKLVKDSVAINKEAQEAMLVCVAESKEFFDCEKDNPVAFNCYIGMLAHGINNSAAFSSNE